MRGRGDYFFSSFGASALGVSSVFGAASAFGGVSALGAASGLAASGGRGSRRFCLLGLGGSRRLRLLGRGGSRRLGVLGLGILSVLGLGRRLLFELQRIERREQGFAGRGRAGGVERETLARSARLIGKRRLGIELGEAVVELLDGGLLEVVESRLGRLGIGAVGPALDEFLVMLLGLLEFASRFPRASQAEGRPLAKRRVRALQHVLIGRDRLGQFLIRAGLVGEELVAALGQMQVAGDDGGPVGGVGARVLADDVFQFGEVAAGRCFGHGAMEILPRLRRFRPDLLGPEHGGDAHDQQRQHDAHDGVGVGLDRADGIGHPVGQFIMFQFVTTFASHVFCLTCDAERGTEGGSLFWWRKSARA